LPSLLDVVDARERKSGRESLTHLCYVATTSSDESAASIVAAHDEACVADALAGGSLTGICLAQNGCVLHYLECPSPTLLSILREVRARLPLTGVLGSEGCRVLVASEDCDQRYFESWTRMELEANDEGEISVPAGDEATTAAFDILKTLISVGEGLASTSSEGVEVEDELLPAGGSSEGATLVQNVCPSKGRIKALSESTAFFTLDEYLEAFGTAVAVQLESEDVWPYQPTVNYESLTAS